MLKVILKLLLLSFSVVAILGMILITLQTLTQNPSPHILKHPWVEKVPWSLVRLKSCPTPDAATKILSNLGASDLLWLDIHFNASESEWKYFCGEHPISELRAQDLGQDHSLLPLLTSSAFKSKSVLLNVHARQTTQLEGLLNELKDFEDSKSLGMISPVRTIIAELRKRRPQWIFGADQPSVAKARAFHSLKLLGLIELWPDFYILPRTLLGSESEVRDFSQALEKHGKIVVLESTQRWVAP